MLYPVFRLMSRDLDKPWWNCFNWARCLAMQATSLLSDPPTSWLPARPAQKRRPRHSETAGPWRTDRACGQRPPLPNVAFWPYKKTSCLPAAKFQHEPLAASVFFSSSCLSASSRFWHSLLLACPFFSFGPLLLVSPPLTRSPCWRQGSADIPIDIITDIIYFPS